MRRGMAARWRDMDEVVYGDGRSIRYQEGRAIRLFVRDRRFPADDWRRRIADRERTYKRSILCGRRTP